MGRYLSQAPRVKKQQVFTVSGTFTPSSGLLAAGGVVEVRCVGGGGGCHQSIGSGGGGSGADITRIVTVTGPLAVIIGAAGQSSNVQDSVSNGGTTSFAALVVAPGGTRGGEGSSGGVGNVGIAGSPGKAGGEGGFNGRPGFHRSTTIHNGVGNVTAHFDSGAGGGAGPGCGAGHFVSANGIQQVQRPAESGLCIITWEE